jgi:hypothetical protein
MGQSASKTPVAVLNVMLTLSTKSFGGEDSMHTPVDRAESQRFPSP